MRGCTECHWSLLEWLFVFRAWVPGISLSLRSLAASPTTSPGLKEDTTSSLRFCFPYILRHVNINLVRQQQKHARYLHFFSLLHCTSEEQPSCWAYRGHLTPEESSQQITHLQPSLQRQLLGTANQVARGCKILLSQLHIICSSTTKY